MTNGIGILWGVIQSPLIISPLYPVGSPHHTTLQFGVVRQDWKEWENLEFQATTLYEAWNGNIQAVAIQLPDHIPCRQNNPHISVSWCKGIKPYESNLMLSSKFDYRLFKQSVKMKIEFLEWIE
jgi:hypothetical protein